MGLFNNIFGRKVSANNMDTPVETQGLRKSMDITKDSIKLICVDDNSVDKNYNATCLIVDRVPASEYASDAYRCSVTWYKELRQRNFLDRYSSSNPLDFLPVIAQLDLNALFSDNDYYACVVKDLLERNRVIRQLRMRLGDVIPEGHSYYKCGIYVGGVHYKNENGKTIPDKYVNKRIAEVVHNSSDTQKYRRSYKEAEERAKTANTNPKGYYPEVPRTGYDNLVAYGKGR